MGGQSRAEYCNRSSPSADSTCEFAISTKKDDAIFKGRKIPFTRSPYSIGSNSFQSKDFMKKDRRYFSERKYINIITHFIDASTVC